MRYSLLALAAGVVVLTSQFGFADSITEWNFNETLAASHGTATMTEWNAGETSYLSYSTTKINDVDKKVLNFSAFSPTQALLVNTGAVNSYTMIWDINIPTPASDKNYGVLYNTSAPSGGSVSKDGTFCLKKASDSTFGVGSDSVYSGTATFDNWHRVAITVETVTNGKYTVSTYIDGNAGISDRNYEVGVTSANNLNAEIKDNGFLLFGDESNETWAGQMSMFYFRDSVMSAGDIAKLGGVTADGIAVPEPGTIALLVAGCLSLVAYAWRKRK